MKRRGRGVASPLRRNGCSIISTSWSDRTCDGRSAAGDPDFLSRPDLGRKEQTQGSGCPAGSKVRCDSERTRRNQHEKTTSLEQNRVRQPRAGGVRKAGVSVVPKAKGVKLPPSRKEEPAGLLEEFFSEDGEAYMVSFEYFNPTAHEVSVAGSFNGWQTGAAPLKQQRGEKWSTSLLLAPGRYEYRFVVDDQWQDDPMVECFVATRLGD